MRIEIGFELFLVRGDAAHAARQIVPRHQRVTERGPKRAADGGIGQVTLQARDRQLWRRHLEYVDRFRAEMQDSADALKLKLDKRVRYAQEQLRRVSAAEYLDELRGTLGADPLRTAGA